jgi:hypothetical protein
VTYAEEAAAEKAARWPMATSCRALLVAEGLNVGAKVAFVIAAAVPAIVPVLDCQIAVSPCLMRSIVQATFEPDCARLTRTRTGTPVTAVVITWLEIITALDELYMFAYSCPVVPLRLMTT